MSLPESLWADARATAEGAAVGAGAFAAGLAATFLLQRDALGDSQRVADGVSTAVGPALADALGDVADWLEPDVLEVVAWFYYAAHGVTLDVTAGALGRSAHWTADLRQTPLWDGQLALVPPLALLAAGGFLAWRHRDREPGAATSGVRVALGYAAAAAVVATAATYTRDAGFATVTLRPPLVAAVAYCAAYALAFGALGAFLASGLGDGGGGESATGPGRPRQ
ncbi:hypothetical protein [Halobacterium yunchengense]|uniref:hypothetical protein n=1 Tax=Halobacterium yunchengense TaxID=3108497 RepID=UPI00300B77F0